MPNGIDFNQIRQSLGISKPTLQTKTNIKPFIDFQGIRESIEGRPYTPTSLDIPTPVLTTLKERPEPFTLPTHKLRQQTGMIDVLQPLREQPELRTSYKPPTIQPQPIAEKPSVLNQYAGATQPQIPTSIVPQESDRYRLSGLPTEKIEEVRKPKFTEQEFARFTTEEKVKAWREDPGSVIPLLTDDEIVEITKLNPPFVRAFPGLTTIGRTDDFDKFLREKVPFVARATQRGADIILGKDSADLPEAGTIGNILADISGTVLGYASPLPGLGGTSMLGATQTFTQPFAQQIGLKIAEKTGGTLLPRLATGAIREGLEGLILGGFEGLYRGDDPAEILKRAGIEAGVGAVLGTAFEGLGAVLNKLKAGKLEKIELPSVKNIEVPEGIPAVSKGKYTIKNTELEKAMNAYNKSIERIQDYFGKSKLEIDEIPRIKSELGIDLDSLVADIKAAEELDLRSQLLQAGERQRIGAVAGAVDLPPIQRPLDVIQETPTAQLVPELKAETIDIEGVGPVARLQPNAPFTEITDPATGQPRRFAQSVIDSDIAPPELKEAVQEANLRYDPITNADTWERAKQSVTTNSEEALTQYRRIDDLSSADDTALGQALIVDAINKGDINLANELTADLATKLTRAGQTVQAASIINRLTPEGMLIYAQRTIDKANRNLADLFGTKAKLIKLGTGESKIILNIMKKAEKLTGRAKDIEIAKVMKLINDKIPSTMSEKVKGLQRISLLLNPKTLLRNIYGNVILGIGENIKDIPASLVDMAVSKVANTPRTTLFPSISGIEAQLKGFGKGLKETIEDARLGIDTTLSTNKFELPRGKTFENAILDRLDQATKVGLQLGDRPFWKATYEDSIRQQLKIANLKEPTEAMVQQASKLANERTFQNVTALSNAFEKARRALNLGKEFGLGNIVLPFSKTPANILDKAIEYSPAGFLKAAKQVFDIGKGKFNQKVFSDVMGRALTGTGIIMLGYDLAKKGIVTGKGSKDSDVRQFERSIGKLNYAFNTNALLRMIQGESTDLKSGDQFSTYDWAQPLAIPLAIGADMYFNGKDRKGAENVVWDAVTSGGSTLFQQSLLQGIQRFFGGYDPVQSVSDTLLNFPTQFVPTLFKQVAQVKDPTARTTYDPDAINEIGRKLKARIPGARETLVPSITTLGEEARSYPQGSEFFDVFINPSYRGVYQETPVSQMILELYDQTGQTIHFPRVAPKEITIPDYQNKGQTVKYTLTPEQYAEFQRRLGEETKDIFSKYANSNTFRKKPAESQIKTLQRALTDARQKVEEMFEKEILVPKLGGQ